MTSIFKFEEVKTPYGKIPGPGIDAKVVNVNNSLTTRHKLLKIDTRGIFMTMNSMVISSFKVEQVMSPYGRPPWSGVDPKFVTDGHVGGGEKSFLFRSVPR